MKVCRPGLWKRLIFIAGLALTGLTFVIVFGRALPSEMGGNDFLLIISNGTCIGAGVWFYRLLPKPEIIAKT